MGSDERNAHSVDFTVLASTVDLEAHPLKVTLPTAIKWRTKSGLESVHPYALFVLLKAKSS